MNNKISQSEKKELKKQIATEVIVTPWTVMPMGTGISLMVLSLITGPVTAGIGLGLCFFGASVLMVNLLFNFKKIEARVTRNWKAAKETQNRRYLDKLDYELARNKDPRDQTALRDLRALYGDFKQDVESGKISNNVTPDMISFVDQIFECCVHELQQASNIHRSMRNSVSPALKEQLQEQRNEIIEAVQDSITNLSVTINELRLVQSKAGTKDLRDLGSKLSRHLDNAKRVEERMATMGLNEDSGRFDKYVTKE